MFQPFFVDFNLPVSLTRNDEVGVPIVVYNYLDQPQTVDLTIQDAAWYERLPTTDEKPAADGERETGAHKLSVELRPGEVRSVTFPVRVLSVGRQQLEVAAIGSGISDAVRREIEVVPNGVAVEQVVSGTLSSPLTMTLNVPGDAIEGSVQAVVKLYPSSFSQLVEGLDAILRMPSGCFEQTSSTTYPNVLALDYRKDTAVGYQVTFRYHVERSDAGAETAQEPFSVDIVYDRKRLNVDETVTAVATVVNNMDAAAPMVILDLPIPGGFAIDPGELDELVGSQRIAKYQITARQAIVYLRRLEPGHSLELRYRLRPTMPVKVTVPDGQAYEYYDPDRRGQGGATRLEVVEA